jgi:hypothetical protein
VAVEVAQGLIDDLAATTGWMKITIQSTAEAERSREATALAAKRIAAIRHPEEPEEQFASLIEADERHVYADMHDAEAYPGVLEAVVDAVVSAVRDAGIADAVIASDA